MATSKKKRFNPVDGFAEQSVIQIYEDQIPNLMTTSATKAINNRIEKFNNIDKYKIFGGFGSALFIDSAKLPNYIIVKNALDHDDKILFDLLSREDKSNNTNLNYYIYHGKTIQDEPITLNSSIGNSYEDTKQFLSSTETQQEYVTCIESDSDKFNDYIDQNRSSIESKLIDMFLDYVKFFVEKFKKNKSILNKYNRDYIKERFAYNLSDYNTEKNQNIILSGRSLYYTIAINGDDDVYNGGCKCVCTMNYKPEITDYEFNQEYSTDKDLYQNDAEF